MVFREHIHSFAKGLKKAIRHLKRRSRAKTSYLEKIRQKYPKAYAQWTENDDNALRNRYYQGLSVDELSCTFQRQPSAIRSRLRKLGLAEGEITHQ